MSTLPPNSIQIPRPAPKAVSEVQVPPKAYLNFLFSLQGATSAKQGDDLVIELPDGSKVLCLGYYSNTAEGDRPQIAVNGEALPPSSMDLQLFTHQVEGLRPEGDPEGTPEGTEQGAQGAENRQEAGANAPASSGATATGDSATAGDSDPAGQSPASDAAANQSAQGSGSPASSGSPSGGVSGNEGGLKQDMNVDFLGGITRLPGLDLSSDRGFENTTIEGGPIWGNTTTPPPPTSPDTPPVAPPPPTIFESVAGMVEAGFDANKNPVGTDAASHNLTLTVPDGMQAADVVLDFSLFPGAPAGELTPNTVYDTHYGKFSYSVTDTQIPVLDSDGNPVLDESGNPLFRPGVEVTLNYSGLDNTHPDINSLPLGGKLNENMSFTVVGKDASGNNTSLGSANIGFVIEGSNDGPQLAKNASNLAAHLEVKETGVYSDNKLTSEGSWDDYSPTTPDTNPDYGTHKNTSHIQLGVSDVDQGDSHTFSLTNTTVSITNSVGVAWTNPTLVQNSDGSYTLKIDGVACGTLSLSPSGAMVFTLDSNSAVIQAMEAGDASTIKVNVTVTDKGGLSDSGDVTLTIHGTNDRPSFKPGTIFEKSLTESGDNTIHTSVNGKLEGTDPEGSTTTFHIAKDSSVAGKDKLEGDDLDADGKLDGQYGTLVLNPNGTFTYTENGSLRAGESGKDTFTVVVKDDKGAFTTKELTFDVTGKNNKVIFANLDGDNYVIKLVEAGVLAGGNNPNDSTAPGDMQATLTATGNITKTPGGKDFIVDDDADASGPGIANAREFKLVASTSNKPDGSPNDLVIKSTTPADSQGWQTIETEYGMFKFNIYSGDYTYTLKDVGYLTKDDIKTEIFTVQVWKNGVSQGERDFSVTIRGMNDTPEFTQVENLEVTAQGTANTGSLSDQFTAVSKDEDAGDHASHKYSIVYKQNPSDPDDPGPSAKLVQAIKGVYGMLELDPDTGTYIYKLDNDRDATKQLGQNQKGEESFTIRVTDAAGAYDTITITVTVNGAYDKPVISYGGKSIAEDAPMGDREVDGTISITTTDAVHGGSKSFTLVNADGSIPAKDTNGMQTVTTEYGTLIFNTVTGAYTYTLTAAGNDLLQKENIGDIIAQKFNVRVTFPEANGASSTVDTTISVDLKGVNDAPEFTNASETTIEMDRVFLWEKNEGITQKVVAEDVDNVSNSESSSASELTFFFKGPNGEILYTVETTYGRVSINPQTGEYTYTIDPNNASVKGLNKNDPALNDTFKVYVRDPHGAEDEQDINVTINGKDVPAGGDGGFILPTDDLIVKEDGSGLDSTPGQEDTSNPTPPTTSVVRYGFIKVDADGNPIIGADGKPEMTQSLKGQYGDIYIDAYTGQYRYVLNNQLLSVQQMKEGMSASELAFLVYGFTIDASGNPQWVTNPDGSPKQQGSISVTVEGTNDEPVLTHTLVAQGITVYAGTPDTATIAVNGAFTASDVDLNDTQTFGLSAGEPTVDNNPADCTTLTLTEGGITYGTVTINAAGEYQFSYLPGASFAGTKTLTFWVYVKDSAGAYDKEQVTITITTENTKPVIISCNYTDADGNVIPSYAYGNANPDLDIDHNTGNVTLGDVDLTQSMQSALKAAITEDITTIKGSFQSWDNEVAHGVQGENGYAYFLKTSSGYDNLDIQDFGTLSLAQSGAFSFTLNNQSAMVKALQEGDTRILTYKVVVRDANGAYSGEQEFTITITGTNNKPEITATQSLISMHENGDTLDGSGNPLTGVPKFELKLDDADLYKTDGHGNVIDKGIQAQHNFELDGTAKDKGGNSVDLTISGGKQSGGSYTFTVEAGGVTYGQFYLQVDPTDASKVSYWFVVDPSMKDYLTKNDNVTLNFKLNFIDGFTDGKSNDAFINVNIKGDNTLPEISATDTNIILAENASDSHHNLTITDSDLGTDSTKHDFGLVGKGTTTIGTENKNSTGTEYSFEVKQDGVLYGKLHMQVDPTNPKQVEYWFEIDNAVKDSLFTGDRIDLNFDIIFKDEYGGTSGGKNITVTINGAGDPPAPVPPASSVHSADIAPDEQHTSDSQKLADDPTNPLPEGVVDGPAFTTEGALTDASPSALPEAPTEAPALAVATATPLVSALASPDTTLPGMAPTPLPIVQDTAHAQAQPLTLESPLPDMPTPQLTNAPGQEALQFQLQTTGV